MAASRDALREKIIEALKTVYDPEIPVNVYDLGLVYGIDIDDEGRVKVRLGVTAPGCPVAYQIAYMAEEAIRQNVPEAKDVEVEIDVETPWDPRRVTQEGRRQLMDLFGYDIVEEWIKRYDEMMKQSPTGS
ncbi:MAG: phenylacetic acid degradation protein [Hyperthermus sp.]|nr:MAG: phenylacetic acid degradation protein [Hyperthermus sp.]